MSGTVLVTGSSGTIGSALCRELLDEGWSVRALRRETSSISHLEDLSMTWHVGDVTRAADCQEAVTGVDHVVHLAGAGLTDASPKTVREVNVTGTENVLRSSRRAGVERFVFASTAGTRRCDGIADETDTAPPVGAYQESKADAEALVDAYVEEGFDAVTVHPTSVFAPGDEAFTGRLCKMALDPKFFAALPGGASFVSATDVATGIRLALERGDSGEHYILGGENLTYREALSVIAESADGNVPPIEIPRPIVIALGHAAERLESTVEIRAFPYDPDMARLATERMFYSSGKAQEALGYEYRPLTDHVGAALDWFQHAREAPSPGERN
ncbi:SDR family NAD(P)-dependent oxidoreductase [Halosimplex amylolyticum]|uniref:SDR family NAD(P)-dependent oxidoreductase n=1 Tax=Halosimplex amylolyticum TaxID=3396616 RepID=UPI003F555A4B